MRSPGATGGCRGNDHYDQRSAVEPVNARFDDPFIRGLAKMRPRCTTGLSIMLAALDARAH